MLLKRPCPGCKVVLITVGTRCDACQRTKDAARGTTTARGLGWRYQRKRNRILHRDRFVCGICGGIGADTIDHIVPRSQGGTDDDDNLRAAHGRCNSGRRA